MASVPIPVRASVRDLLTDLLSRQVTVAVGMPQVLDPQVPALAAAYVDDGGTPRAVCVVDLPLAVHAGAALGTTPPEEAGAAVEGGKLEGDLEEFFREVVNILTKLLNSPTSPHVRLSEVKPVPGRLPAAVAHVVLEPEARVDYAVSVEGYGGGTMTLLAADPARPRSPASAAVEDAVPLEGGEDGQGGADEVGVEEGAGVGAEGG